MHRLGGVEELPHLQSCSVPWVIMLWVSKTAQLLVTTSTSTMSGIFSALNSENRLEKHYKNPVLQKAAQALIYKIVLIQMNFLQIIINI